MERDLKSGSVSGSGGGGRPAIDAPPTPTRKLGKAIADENERFLGGQSQQQQQIIRWAVLRWAATGVVGGLWLIGVWVGGDLRAGTCVHSRAAVVNLLRSVPRPRPHHKPNPSQPSAECRTSC